MRRDGRASAPGSGNRSKDRCKSAVRGEGVRRRADKGGKAVEEGVFQRRRCWGSREEGPRRIAAGAVLRTTEHTVAEKRRRACVIASAAI